MELWNSEGATWPTVLTAMVLLFITAHFTRKWSGDIGLGVLCILLGLGYYAIGYHDEDFRWWYIGSAMLLLGGWTIHMALKKRQRRQP